MKSQIFFGLLLGISALLLAVDELSATESAITLHTEYEAEEAAFDGRELKSSGKSSSSKSSKKSKSKGVSSQPTSYTG